MERKSVVLVGAAGGLGRSVFGALSDSYHVISVGRSRDESRKNFFEVDISDFDQTHRFSKELNVVPYAVVNCVGHVTNAPLWKLSSEQWDQTWMSHVSSCFHLISAFAPMMRTKGVGRFVFFSSIVSRRGAFGASHYAAAKGAIEALTRSAALELANKNITVNAIAPGYMDSGVIRDVPPNILTELITRIPLGRLGPSSHVGALVRYLLSDEAGYMTGQTLGLDGGL